MTYVELTQWLKDYNFVELTASDPCFFWVEKQSLIMAQIRFEGGEAKLAQMTKTDMVTIFSIVLMDYHNWGYSEKECIELAHARLAELGLSLSGQACQEEGFCDY